MGRINEWLNLPRSSDEYGKGLEEYLSKAFATKAVGNQIVCPCKDCDCRYWFSRDVVKDHLICAGFGSRGRIQLEKWSELFEQNEAVGEKETVGENGTVGENETGPPIEINDNLGGLFRDLREGPDEETKNFLKLVADGEQELYPGCKKFSKLSFTIRLFIFKCDNKLSNASFEDLLELLKALLPDAKLPNTFNEAKNTIKSLGLDYTKIDACPNDCMLYWEEYENATSCHVCGTSRWKYGVSDEGNTSDNSHRISAKILRYFPIVKRLQRLYMCEQTAEYMRWHAEGRPKDGLMRHLADGEDWKQFDRRFAEFAKDPRNVRLGLSTDGFSPFNSMGIVHSTWPVILMNYNLPPWISLKPEFFMLALLIPGPTSPSNDIDIYLQPLVKDLMKLWTDGVETYDAVSGTRFSMHAALISTVSDFPGYAMLSGWSTKGKTACPCCHYETCSESLKFSRKKCYMDHRRFLEPTHSWRHDDEHFNGKFEDRMQPQRLSGEEIEEILSDWENDFGKGRKDKEKIDDDIPWRKKVILFDLPYWKYLMLRHNLDVMHIEKNVFDNILNTLLEIPTKSKDGVQARKDLDVLKIMPHLQGKQCGDYIEYPRSRFWLSPAKKRTFCQVIKCAKLPYGYASNISRCVKVQERRIQGYKSHDAHFMMQNLLPVAARVTLPEDVAVPIIKLGNFFKSIYKKEIDPSELEGLQTQIARILCELENIFPPAFFDVMEHLTVHLVEEIKLGGPVAQRCMYAIERYLRRLKSNTGNKSRPEASMAEAQLILESVGFCSRYLKEISTMGQNSPALVPLPTRTNSADVFCQTGYPLKGKGRTRKLARDLIRMDAMSWIQAHRYVVFNCDTDEMEKYRNEHKSATNNPRKRKWDSAQIHSNDFSQWLKDKVKVQLLKGLSIPDYIQWLARGPSHVARRHTGYFINGYRFHTRSRDLHRVTQNSGVTLSSLTPSFSSRKDKNPVIGEVTYYGVIEEIIEIYYYGSSSGVVLFKCGWFHSEIDSYGLTCVNRSRPIAKVEPFILASQAHQVFYVDDPRRNGWQFAVEVLPKGLLDGEEDDESS